MEIDRGIHWWWHKEGLSNALARLLTAYTHDAVWVSKDAAG